MYVCSEIEASGRWVSLVKEKRADFYILDLNLRELVHLEMSTKNWKDGTVTRYHYYFHFFRSRSRWTAGRSLAKVSGPGSRDADSPGSGSLLRGPLRPTVGNAPIRGTQGSGWASKELRDSEDGRSTRIFVITFPSTSSFLPPPALPKPFSPKALDGTERRGCPCRGGSCVAQSGVLEAAPGYRGVCRGGQRSVGDQGGVQRVSLAGLTQHAVSSLSGWQGHRCTGAVGRRASEQGGSAWPQSKRSCPQGDWSNVQ